MKYYFFSAGLILLAIIVAIIVPIVVNSTENVLLGLQIPQNNAEVAGVQKYLSPPVSANLSIPEISARAVFIKDLTTDTILYQKDANIPLPIASTTKIATALVAGEYFKPNSVLTVGDGAKIEGAKVGLVSGESLSFRSVLYGMLLNSGNDAAFTIAENYPGGVLGFVSAMNKKAMDLNLPNTHFQNPAGFDDKNHFSSASDLARISEEALKNYQLARIFSTKETDIVSLDKKYTHKLINLNKLLSSLNGVLGIKTGTTKQAKENLVTLVERDNHRVLLVVLGSDDRFGETTRLIDWTYANFRWSEIPG
ncbi:MAG: D-alanyl-D-alanine carboxypeptidase family protein [Candidatus Daviesbacteria bacterium]|nr:D-alanyl-D-alanine carboxypeptidase family protein [Candidatus Daviesbacteria bacterium]